MHSRAHPAHDPRPTPSPAPSSAAEPLPEPREAASGRRLAALELTGEHVRLRPHRREDAGAAFELLVGQEEILRWLVWDGPASAEELADYYGEWHVAGEGGPDLRLAIEERESGRLSGSLAVRFTGHAGQGDIGYWVARPFQGRGLGREAVALAARLAFRHLDAHALYAWVFVGNAASRRVLEHNGFTLARTVPGRVQKRGLRVDEWHFVLLASEWRRLAAPLRPRVEAVAWGDPGKAKAHDSPTGPVPLG